MFRDNLKKERKPFSFEDELQQKLKNIKNDVNSKSTHKKTNKAQMIDLLDHAVYQLQEPEAEVNLLPEQSRARKTKNVPFKEVEELKLNQEPSIIYRQQERERISGSRSNKKIKKQDLKNHISNLTANIEVQQFLKEHFRSYTQSDSISIYDFIQKGVFYEVGIKVREVQIYKMKQLIQNDLTTTNNEVISLNALQILTKKMSLKHYIIHSYVEAKVKLSEQEIESKKKKLLSGVTDRIDNLSYKEQQLQHYEKDLLKRQTTVSTKEKSIIAKQKELIQRQKQLKKSIEDKCMKMYETYMNQGTEVIKDAEKRLSTLEKSIKNKIEILERRAQNLKLLIQEKNQLKNKKTTGDNEARIKLRKIQKDYEIMQKKYKAQIDQIKSEQSDLMKTIATLEDKVAKNQKKYKKYKQKAEENESQLVLLKGKAAQLEEKNTQIHQKYQELKIKVPQQNLMKEVKTKEGMTTNRQKKSKTKKIQKDMSSLISAYEHVLSVSSLNQHFKSRSVPCTTQLMKQLLPLVVGQLCSEEEIQQQDNRPHLLVLFVSQLAMKQSHKEEGNRNFIWSKQLSELLYITFEEATTRSLFMFMLPIIDWYNSVAVKFFKRSIELLVRTVQDGEFRANALVFQPQRQYQILEGPLLRYLVANFLTSLESSLKECSQEEDAKLQYSLPLAHSVVDFLVALSCQDHKIDHLKASSIAESLKTVFQCLIGCIINIYNAETKSSRQKNPTIFKHYQTIEEMAEKTSILVQRITYRLSQQKLQGCTTHSKRLPKLFKQLSQINLLNGNRHSLILANMNSILSLKI